MRCSHCREININLMEDCVAATSASGIPKARSRSLWEGTSFDVLSTCKASESMAGRKWENNFLQEKLEKVDQAITFSC